MFRARIVPTLDAIIDAHPGETVVVVCHGGVINVYLAALLGLDRSTSGSIPAYTSISRVRAARGRRALARVAQRDRAPRTRPGRRTA